MKLKIKSLLLMSYTNRLGIDLFSFKCSTETLCFLAFQGDIDVIFGLMETQSSVTSRSSELVVEYDFTDELNEKM